MGTSLAASVLNESEKEKTTVEQVSFINFLKSQFFSISRTLQSIRAKTMTVETCPEMRTFNKKIKSPTVENTILIKSVTF